MTDKTGGAAFPVPATELHGTTTGMSLRDYFAAKAMNADLSNSDESLAGYGSQFTDAQLENFAAFYYRMADAMLKARG
ncbi:hypothetical protein ACXN08_13780 [Proteus mirabilis]|uniref:hypothetical protein n=1 Tax=Proteus mirabilis TaxID=584 RepID=UPI0023F9393F|nr:hypothetical protein [Proteus mirabilis]MDF7422950.1 hypothetical protein [Proteus mirabilis]HEH1842227.1 hypothetical protein [Proteus mirabilis]HEJ9586884.1 hypothetical protein [Proteus mirabilis]